MFRTRKRSIIYKNNIGYGENIIFVYDLISDTFCITPVLDKCVKSIMEGMFTNKNYRKKREKCI
jgi:hypothetical protein